ncbi:MAG TPA: L-glutamate gamma-semialdehyde dehydrogenase [Thermoanaerobaculia bacterium]
MSSAVFEVPIPENEPIHDYAPGSPERASLKKALDELLDQEVEIPVVIGGEEVRTGDTATCVCPHDHGHVLGTYHQAGEKEVARAVEAAKAAWVDWSEMPWEERAAVFLRAAELLTGPRRDLLNASSMLDQSKTAHQAEIDVVCELADFWRFNPAYMRQLYAMQSRSEKNAWNRMEYRPLEGFVFAVTPFNFASISGNLPTSPALMGNVALWKPASSIVYTCWRLFQVLREAGLPDGVINFLPGRGRAVGDPALASPDLAGLHFTGSTDTFQGMWRTIAQNLPSYGSYPRIVGETGGKDYVFAHPSADAAAVATALVRGAFEYQGQKCSAASRAYVPKSLWKEVREGVEEQVGRIRMGAPTDFRNFMAAVIDEKAFGTITGYIAHAKESAEHEVILGGGSDDSKGWFIEPTVVVSTDPRSKLMKEEIFGPVLTLFVYEDRDLEKTAELVDTTSPYGLTGAIFANDRRAVVDLSRRLRHSAGNFYVNDKPTGAVVSQQPFGGGRASGTNDKAGSIFNLMRWVSQRAIKETFVPATDFPYPFMGEK